MSTNTKYTHQLLGRTTGEWSSAGFCKTQEEADAALANRLKNYPHVEWKLVLLLPLEVEELLAFASKRSRYWITDAVANKRSGAGDDISEAADNFVSENGKDSKHIVNRVLVLLGEEPVFA